MTLKEVFSRVKLFDDRGVGTYHMKASVTKVHRLQCNISILIRVNTKVKNEVSLMFLCKMEG